MHRLSWEEKFVIRVACSIPQLHFSTDHKTQAFKFDKKFMTFISDRSVSSSKALPQSGLSYYTDGSLMNGSAGAGVFCEQEKVNSW